MIKELKYLLLIAFILFGATDTFSAKPKTKILVLGLDSTQFYSNVFYKSELAFFNDTTAGDVVSYYGKMIMAVLANHDSRDFAYIFADSAETAQVHAESEFIESQSFDEKPFIGIAAKDLKSQTIQKLLKKHQANYLLSLNAYEIYRENPPQEIAYYINTEHLIHYDVFDTTLNAVYAGRFGIKSNAVEAGFMAFLYQKFAEEVILRIEAFELKDFQGSFEQRYKEARERRIKKTGGLGVSLGVGAPYGALGIEWTKYLASNLDVNVGIGYDFSGFKAGAGIRYYLDNVSIKYKPFLGLGYSWASGATLKLGGEKDDMGNYINQDDVSKFKIRADHALHFRAGFRFIFGKSVLLLSGGYGYAFGAHKAELITDKKDPKEKSEYQGFADFMAVGGLDAGITYIFYLP